MVGEGPGAVVVDPGAAGRVALAALAAAVRTPLQTDQSHFTISRLRHMMALFGHGKLQAYQGGHKGHILPFEYNYCQPTLAEEIEL